MISLIAAIGKNRELGKDNKLLWHIPEDLKRFRELTKGHPIIMGRKTFESIGRVLPDRLNVVITRDKQRADSREQRADNLIFVGSLEEAIDASIKNQESRIKGNNTGGHTTKYILPNTDENEIFIIGGGQIFEQAMDIADKLYLTIVDGDFDADTFFPKYDAFDHIVSQEKSSYNGISYTFLELSKSDPDSIGAN
jgi:dihydrofolate reductase